ncbi:MAG TPA: hypothetical protein VJB94_04130 [Candidatus Nanoarchaeia archaeon]|nr:hypothetical protein [Candidatus Nanoarchaeia archaeon]
MDKGIEFSFKAIFVSIAGAILVMILVNFAVQQTDLFGRYSNRAIVNSFEKQLDAFSVSSSSKKIINLPEKIKMRFDCNALITEDFSEETGRIIFAPPEIESEKIKAATKTWSFPFRITNFFYLSNEEDVYFIVFDAESKEYVDSLDLPDFKILKIDARNFNANQISEQAKNLKRANLILFTKQVNENELTKLKNLNIVRVNLKQNDAMYNNENFFFLDEAMLIGLITSPENYNCQKEKAIEKLSIISNINSQKASYLALKANNECKNYLLEIKSSLDVFRNQKEKNSLLNLNEKIKEQNNNLIRNDCQKIY